MGKEELVKKASPKKTTEEKASDIKAAAEAAAEELMQNEITGKFLYPKCANGEKIGFMKLAMVYNNSIFGSNFELAKEISTALTFFYYFKNYRHKNFLEATEVLQTCFQYENVWIHKKIHPNEARLLLFNRVNELNITYKYSISELTELLNEKKSIKISRGEWDLKEKLDSIMEGNFNKTEAYSIIAKRLGPISIKAVEKRVERVRKSLKNRDESVFEARLEELMNSVDIPV